LCEENESLRAENAKYEAENHEQFNKWLKLEKATKRHHAELFEEAKIAVKEETVRKMQERFNQIFGGMDATSILLRKTFDQIAKEMIGEGENKLFLNVKNLNLDKVIAEATIEVLSAVDKMFDRQPYDSRWVDDELEVVRFVDVCDAMGRWYEYTKPELIKKLWAEKHEI
jgi:hypothetical protein